MAHCQECKRQLLSYESLINCEKCLKEITKDWIICALEQFTLSREQYLRIEDIINE